MTFKTAYSHVYEERVTFVKMWNNRGLDVYTCEISDGTHALFTLRGLRDFKN